MMREQAMATAVELFERDERVAIVMADISLDYLRPGDVGLAPSPVTDALGNPRAHEAGYNNCLTTRRLEHDVHEEG